MIVNCYTDPISINLLCDNLRVNGIAIMNTTRPNFRAITDQVEQVVNPEIIPTSVKTPDHDWHHVLIYTEVITCHIAVIEARVQQAIHAWKSAGYPASYSLRI